MATENIYIILLPESLSGDWQLPAALNWFLSSIDGVATNSRVSDWPTLTSNFASDWRAIVSLMKFARNSIDGFENNGPQNSPGKYELL
jgi:hypothetical protein